MGMSEAELEELWKRYRERGEARDRDRLILHYAPLVKRVVHRMGIVDTPSLDFHDLVSHGVSGLIEAVDRYDPQRGVSFSAFATQRIRGSVLDALRRLDFLSRAVRHQSAEIERAIAELRQQLGEIPTDEQVAEHLGMDLDGYRQVLNQANVIFLSLDSPLADIEAGEENLILSEALEDPSVHDIFEEIEERDLRQELVGAIRELPEREQLALSLYYYEELTIREVAEVLSLSPSRVSQLLGKAIMTLRARLLYGQAPTPMRGSNRLRMPAAAQGLAMGLMVAVMIWLFGFTATWANGAPVDIFLGYLPNVSTWGPQDATGKAVVAVGEAEISIDVKGLPRLTGEHYEAWLQSRADRKWYPAGILRTTADGTGNLHQFLDNLPYQEYRLLLLSVEKDGTTPTEPSDRTTLGGYFPNPAVAHATPATGSGTGPGGTPAVEAPPHLPITGAAGVDSHRLLAAGLAVLACACLTVAWRRRRLSQ